MKYDYLEYFVGMAKMVAFWHVKALGFEVKAYSGPETGCGELVSYLLVKNDIQLVITSAYQPTAHSIVKFVDTHGNSMKRLAISVENVTQSFQKALKHGAIPLIYPTKIEDEAGWVEQAHLKLFDDNEIILINRSQYKGAFKPYFQAVQKNWGVPHFDSQLDTIDHIACALRENEMQYWEQYCQKIFQAQTVQTFEKNEIIAAQTGLYMKVLQTNNKLVNQVLVEPVNHLKKSQVQTFIDANYGTGFQHIAFTTENIIATKQLLEKNGVEFTSYPATYYENLRLKYPHLSEKIAQLQQNNILCDVVEDTLLFQTFTQPIGDRPTLFYEIVQRVNNYNGFGAANVKTLFEAVEQELSKNNSKSA